MARCWPPWPGAGSLDIWPSSAYRTAFAKPKAAIGLQPDRVGGVPVWVLPNPSGLNAHYTVDTLAAAYAELREAAVS